MTTFLQYLPGLVLLAAIVVALLVAIGDGPHKS